MLQNLLRRSALAAGLAAASLAAPAVASAQSGFWAQVQVGSPLAGYGSNGYITVNGLNGFVANGSITQLSSQFGQAVQGGLSASNFKFFCTDPNNFIGLPSTYTAWISYISPTANMSQTRLGSPTVLEPGLTPNSVYTQNASLASTIAVGSGNYAANQTAQSRIWQNVNSANSSPNGNYTNYGSTTFNANGWFVVTAEPSAGQSLQPGGYTQELLAYSSTVQTLSTVPEPGTYALLVPALLVVGGVARRRRSAAQLA